MHLFTDSKQQCTKCQIYFKITNIYSFGNFPEILQCFLTKRFQKFPKLSGSIADTSNPRMFMMTAMMNDDYCACRAEKIVNIDDEPHTESSQELHQLMDSRAKCCNNLAAAQMKVFYCSLPWHFLLFFGWSDHNFYQVQNWLCTIRSCGFQIQMRVVCVLFTGRQHSLLCRPPLPRTSCRWGVLPVSPSVCHALALCQNNVG